MSSIVLLTSASYKMVLPITPVPASRPRVTRQGHAYYGKKYSAFRAEADRVLGNWNLPSTLPFGNPIHLEVAFYCPRPKKTNRAFPRGDVDNYLKTLDVLNRVVWYDDDQIVSLEACKLYGDEPRIELEVTEYGELPTP